MPATKNGETWEIALRAAARSGKPGWTVGNSNGKIRLKYRPPGSKVQQGVVLPLPWAESSIDKATLLINKIAKLIEGNEEATLKGVLAKAQGSSTTMKPTLDWQTVADSLKRELMTGRNEILESTWRDNYQSYIAEALRLIDANAVNDGHELLRDTLIKWEGKPASRAACCIALRNLTDHAIARHNAPRSWQITPVDIKTLKGKAPKKRKKATLTDLELQYLIGGIEKRNPRWATIIRILTLFGLRPIELQHLKPTHKSDADRTPAIWCSYEKTCGSGKTEPRMLEPCWLIDTDGTPIKWDIIERMHTGTLELPLGNDGQPRKLDGHYVEVFLKRQPEWQELMKVCADRGEWLRPYSFRDTFSLRCHRQKIELGAICDAMGHNLEAHARAYRWASEMTTSAAFAAAF